uniref:Uncharacterized protein n=1 Tax=Arundo donax TaxID=35708 RepID=A0A0A8YLG6_ARUDO
MQATAAHSTNVVISKREAIL